jgi:galactose-1-phosphate uridylyltransferase
MERGDAYQMIDAAEKGTVFFRIVISPDPEREDTYQDLSLREITSQTMRQLAERLTKAVPYVAVEHNDHAPHRHVHILACVKGRLNTQDFHALRTTATEAARSQRQERDVVREQQQQEGGQWAMGAAS